METRASSGKTTMKRMIIQTPVLKYRVHNSSIFLLKYVKYMRNAVKPLIDLWPSIQLAHLIFFILLCLCVYLYVYINTYMFNCMLFVWQSEKKDTLFSHKADCSAVKRWTSTQFQWSIITAAARHFPEEILCQARHNNIIIITMYHLPLFFDRLSQYVCTYAYLLYGYMSHVRFYFRNC